MRTGFALVAWLTLLTTPSTLMADPEPDYVPLAYSPANSYEFVTSDRYRLSWYKWDAPATSAELRDPISGHVYSTEVDPAITVNLSGSSVEFHRRGLRYLGTDEAWSLGVNYRRLQLAPDIEMLIKERTERPMVLRVEWSVAFD